MYPAYDMYHSDHDAAQGGVLHAGRCGAVAPHVGLEGAGALISYSFVVSSRSLSS